MCPAEHLERVHAALRRDKRCGVSESDELLGFALDALEEIDVIARPARHRGAPDRAVAVQRHLVQIGHSDRLDDAVAVRGPIRASRLLPITLVSHRWWAVAAGPGRTPKSQLSYAVRPLRLSRDGR